MEIEISLNGNCQVFDDDEELLMTLWFQNELKNLPAEIKIEATKAAWSQIESMVQEHLRRKAEAK